MHFDKSFLVTLLLLQTISYKQQVGATAPTNHVGFFFLSNKPSSWKKFFSNYATLSQFEKEEGIANYSLWVEEDYDDVDIINGIFDDGLDERETESEIDDEHIIDPIIENRKSQWKVSKNSDKTETNNESRDIPEEHPMRTDEWLVEVRLSPFLILPRSIRREASLLPQSFYNNQSSKKKSLRQRRQLMKFGRDGFVLLLQEQGVPDEISGETNNEEINCRQIVTSIGKWQMNANGISWTMPTVSSKQSDESNINTLLHFHADLHLSKFQNKPRMFKGTITRDRFSKKSLKDKTDEDEGSKGKRKLLRPVIASFTAIGIGQDTLALQYKERGFGLSGGNG